MTNKELLHTLKLCLQQRLLRKEVWESEEILSAVDAIIEQMTNSPSRDVPETVFLFWQQEFCDPQGLPVPKKLMAFHRRMMSDVYQEFVAWHLRTSGKLPKISLKAFGGSQGAFLRVSWKYFEYLRTGDGRRIVLRAIPGLF